MIECKVNGEIIRDDLESVGKIKETAWFNLMELSLNEEISDELYFYWDEKFDNAEEWVETPENFISLCSFADPEFEIVRLDLSMDEGVRVLEAEEVAKNGDVIRVSSEEFEERYKKLMEEMGEYNE